MAIQKVKFCDSQKCRAIIDIKKSYIHFPYYGFVGRDFCSELCLKNWAVDVSSVAGKIKIIKIS